mgnify:CR=1 FL=1
MVASRVIRSRSRIVWVTPFRIGWRPVIRADRVGEQVGLTKNRVKRTLRSYRSSRWGVRIQGCPCRPTGPYPWSSVRKISPAELETLEQIIHELEARLANLTQELERAGSNQQVDRVRDLGVQYKEVEKELQTHLSRWAEVAE